MAVGAGQDRDRARRVHADRGGLIETGPRAERTDHCGGSDAAGLDIAGEADATQLPAGLGFRLAGRHAGIVAGAEGGRKRRLVVAGVVHQGHGRLVGKLVRLDEVPAADFRGVDAQLPGGLVDDPLQQVGRLRTARAAVGVHGHGVGEHRPHMSVNQRGLVLTGQQGRVQIGRHAGRKSGEIRAHIGKRIGLQAQELAVRIQRQFGGRDMVAAVGVGDEGLCPVAGPFDRAPQHLRRHRDDGFLGIVIDLGAEAAADIRRIDPQLVLRDRQHERAHQEPDHVRILAGGVERVVAVGGVVVANGAAGLHRVRRDAVVHEFQRRYVRGIGERRIDFRLVAQGPVVADIARRFLVHHRAAAGDGGLHVHRGRQFAVVDHDGFRRLVRRGLALSDDHGDRVAHVADLAFRQDRMLRLCHGRAILVVHQPAAGQAAIGLEVGGGHHLDHARHRHGRADVDGVDRGVSVGAAHDGGVGLARQDDVVHILAAALDKAEILAPQNAGADAGSGNAVIHDCLSRRVSCACRRRPGRPPSRCCGSRCSGRYCPPALCGSPPRSGSGSAWPGPPPS